MIKRIYIFLLVLISTISVEAQMTFENTFGTAYFDEAKSVRQTSDGGYIIGGTNLVKIDEFGIEEWSQPFPSHFANLTDDNGFILINGGSTAIEFTKVSSDGSLVWETTFSEGIWANEGNYIEQTQDGGYIVAGRFQSVTGSGMLLLKLNHEGDKVWHRTYKESTAAGFCYGFAAQQTPDLGYIITGYTYINYYDSTRHKDVFVVKTDSIGTEHWRRYFGGLIDDAANFVRQDTGGNYFIAGYSNSNDTGSDMFLTKLNSNGDSLWTRTYGGAYDDEAVGLWPDNDGGCIIAGKSNSFSSGDYDGYIVKTDSDGNTEWTTSFGGVEDEGLNSVQQTSDDGYIFAGFTNSIGAGDFDMYVLKTDSLGFVYPPFGITNNEVDGVKCNVFPNPNNGIFTINSEKIISNIKIINVLGENVFSSTINNKELFLDLSSHPIGTYFYQVMIEKGKEYNSGIIIIN